MGKSSVLTSNQVKVGGGGKRMANIGSKARGPSVPNSGGKCTGCGKDDGVTAFYSCLKRLCQSCHNNLSHKFQPFICFLVKNKGAIKCLFNAKSIDDNTKGIMLGDLNTRNIDKYEMFKSEAYNLENSDVDVGSPSESTSDEELQDINLLKSRQLSRDLGCLDNTIIDSNFSQITLQNGALMALSWTEFGVNKKSCLIAEIPNFGYLVRVPRKDMN